MPVQKSQDLRRCFRRFFHREKFRCRSYRERRQKMLPERRRVRRNICNESHRRRFLCRSRHSVFCRQGQRRPQSRKAFRSCRNEAHRAGFRCRKRGRFLNRCFLRAPGSARNCFRFSARHSPKRGGLRLHSGRFSSSIHGAEGLRKRGRLLYLRPLQAACRKQGRFGFHSSILFTP